MKSAEKKPEPEVRVTWVCKCGKVVFTHWSYCPSCSGSKP